MSRKDERAVGDGRKKPVAIPFPAREGGVGGHGPAREDGVGGQGPAREDGVCGLGPAKDDGFGEYCPSMDDGFGGRLPATREDPSVRARFEAALEAFVERVRPDPHVLAVIVGGSLAYDVVWEKSDIDMTVVVRDQMLKTDGYCLVEDGIVLSVGISTRSEFVRSLARQAGGSFGQSYMANARVAYATDESLVEQFEAARKIGADDLALSMFIQANMLVSDRDKCRKWLTVRDDPAYAQLYLLKAAERIADMELCLRGLPASRASLRKALALSPETLAPFYPAALTHRFTEGEILSALDGIDAYLDRHLDLILKPAAAVLADGEIRTCTLLAKHFHLDSHFIVGIFEWLADKGVIERAAQTIRITPKGRQGFEELGYLLVLR